MLFLNVGLLDGSYEHNMSFIQLIIIGLFLTLTLSFKSCRFLDHTSHTSLAESASLADRPRPRGKVVQLSQAVEALHELVPEGKVGGVEDEVADQVIDDGKQGREAAVWQVQGHLKDGGEGV